ncbi:MAG: hypothetical protein EXS13_01825 [Planctomycetes bacterium]|nr:hypothetical protein [Planctomycetota bacterium]
MASVKLRASARPPAASEFDRDTTAAPAAARSLRLPLLALLIGAAIWLLPRWPGVLEGRDRAFLVDPAYFELESGAEWLEGGVAQSMRDALAELEPTPLRDDAQVALLTRAIGTATGWVKSVDGVQKRYPNRLEVEVTLREPVALVESEQGLVLIDGDAIVVAVAADAAEFLTRHDLPLLHTSRPLRGVVCGGRVRERALEEGLKVALEIEPFRADLARRGFAIEVIDVTPKERSAGTSITDVELYTASGLAIEWGRSQAHAELGALEPTADAKVRGLKRVAARYPELAGIRRVRLQFSEPSVVFDDEPALVAAPHGE